MRGSAEGEGGGLLSLEASMARVTARLAARQAVAVRSEAAVEDGRQRRAVERRSRTVAAAAQRELFDMGSDERWATRWIRPDNEYPKELTRWPIFVPGNRESQHALLDKDHALPFTTSWGCGRRFGPPLSVYDEDTLIALTHLRQVEVRADAQKLPIPQTGSEVSEAEEVHGVWCLLSDIQAELGQKRGGMNNKLRLASLRRLNGTRIELERHAANAVGARGGAFNLIEVAWERFDDDGLIYAQFPPLMTRLLNESYSYLDFNVRRELPDAGKAVHRFLSGQPRSYCIGAEKLKTTIGYMRSTGSFMRELRETMTRMKSLGWVKAWTISGTGRSHPFMLRIER